MYDGQCTVSWTAPTRNTDGSTLTDLAGFRVYSGLSRSSFSNVLLVAAGKTSQLLTRLPTGVPVYTSVTAVNSLGAESDFSNIESIRLSH